MQGRAPRRSSWGTPPPTLQSSAVICRSAPREKPARMQLPGPLLKQSLRRNQRRNLAASGLSRRSRRRMRMAKRSRSPQLLQRKAHTWAVHAFGETPPKRVRKAARRKNRKRSWESRCWSSVPRPAVRRSPAPRALALTTRMLKQSPRRGRRRDLTRKPRLSHQSPRRCLREHREISAKLVLQLRKFQRRRGSMRTLRQRRPLLKKRQPARPKTFPRRRLECRSPSSPMLKTLPLKMKLHRTMWAPPS
mmetsp:Transcript_17791/g.39005  ORF Transcript_17791/g.39005 Transcript_17791/m.39005 type:complete len:248 (-) Transcript_17791:634-1377(-)